MNKRVILALADAFGAIAQADCTLVEPEPLFINFDTRVITASRLILEGMIVPRQLLYFAWGMHAF